MRVYDVRSVYFIRRSVRLLTLLKGRERNFTSFYQLRKIPIKTFIPLFLLTFTFNLSAQIHCGFAEIDKNTTVSQILTFDTFSKYNGGISVNSVARFRVRVEDKAVVNPSCSWSLIMTINNNPGGGTVGSEWENFAQYGGGLGANPTIDILQVRVRNFCSTSPIDGIYQTFTNNGDIMNIIEPLLQITPAGSCSDNVYGVGSYLMNYDKFNFDIDVRFVPSFLFNPGLYQLNVNFRLE